MMSEPGRYLEAFARSGANGCTVHVEVGGTAQLIEDARALGLRVGLAANPDTPFHAVASFMAEVMEKVEEARREVDRNSLALDIEVDGGIDVATAPIAVRAGANVLVAGSAIFAREDPLAAAAALRAAAVSALT